MCVTSIPLSKPIFKEEENTGVCRHCRKEARAGAPHLSLTNQNSPVRLARPRQREWPNKGFVSDAYSFHSSDNKKPPCMCSQNDGNSFLLFLLHLGGNDLLFILQLQFLAVFF